MKAAQEQQKGAAGSTDGNKKKKKSNKSVGIGFANLARTIAAEWKELDVLTKAPYEARAAAEKSRYDKEMLVWRAKQKEEKAAAAVSSTSSVSAANSTMGVGLSSKMTAVESASASGEPMRALPSLTNPQAASAATVSQPMMQGPSMMMPDNDSFMTTLMMMGRHPMQQSQQHRQQMQQSPVGMSGWSDLYAPSVPFPHHSNAMQMSEMSSSAFQNLAQQQQQQGREPSILQEHQLDLDDAFVAEQHRQQQLQHLRNLRGDGGRVDMLASNPNSRMSTMFGTIDEYQQQSQSLPNALRGRRGTDLISSSLNHHSSSSTIGVDNGHQPQGLCPPSMMDHRMLPDRRRNTWSGMSEAQQQIAQLQYEEELMKEQLQDQRLQYLQQQRQLQQQQMRQRNSSPVSLGTEEIMSDGLLQRQQPGMTMFRRQNLDVVGTVGRNNAYHSNSRGVDLRHQDSWMHENPESPQDHVGVPVQMPQPRQSPQQDQQQISAGLYPSAWFEADDSNMEDAKDGKNRRVDDEPIRYSPDGELNEKLPAKTNTNSSFGGYQDDSVFKPGKKLPSSSSSDMDPWNPIGFKEKSPTKAVAGDNSKIGELDSQEDSPVDPSSLQALGMRLDEETVDFLTKLRFSGQGAQDDSPNPRRQH